MILIFCFNNLFEVLKKFFWCNWGYDKKKNTSRYLKSLEWNLIEQFINLKLVQS